jgi:lysozyme family protein
MTTANFPACLTIILASEGGFVDDPQDPGGATNLGITLNTLSGWLGHVATIADVQALTNATVAPIYQADYWGVCHCDQLPMGVDLMVFDEAANAGPGRAIRDLQTSVGATADGIIGPATLAAVAARNPVIIIGSIAIAREAFYRSLPTFSRFGAGWLARVERTKAAALAMV